MTDHDWTEYWIMLNSTKAGASAQWWKCRLCGMTKEMSRKPTREDLEELGWPATCEEFSVREVMDS